MTEDVYKRQASEHVNHSVNVADVREKLVSEPLALRSTANKTCDIHKFNGSGSVKSGVVHLREFVKTVVGNLNYAYVRVNRAERIVSAGSSCTCECIEKRA